VHVRLRLIAHNDRQPLRRPTCGMGMAIDFEKAICARSRLPTAWWLPQIKQGFRHVPPAAALTLHPSVDLGEAESGCLFHRSATNDAAN